MVSNVSSKNVGLSCPLITGGAIVGGATDFLLTTVSRLLFIAATVSLLTGPL